MSAPHWAASWGDGRGWSCLHPIGQPAGEMVGVGQTPPFQAAPIPRLQLPLDCSAQKLEDACDDRLSFLILQRLSVVEQIIETESGNGVRHSGLDLREKIARTGSIQVYPPLG